MKEYRILRLGGISYLSELEGLPGWCWGMDYTSGDLYEAEELYREGHPIRSNRLVFVHFPDGAVFEPVKAEDGRYLGRPVFWEGSVYILLVDFPEEEIRILRWEAGGKTVSLLTSLSLASVKDCYNLFLTASPLCLTRQGSAGDFQVVWPEQGAFALSPTESLCCRDGECLVFSEWFEDPDYREETVIRRYPDGEVLTRFRAALITAPDGGNWLAE